MTFPEQIETERLLLRWPTEADAEQMFARYASDPAVTKYLTWLPHKSVSDTLKFLRENQQTTELVNWLVFLREGGALLGSIGGRITNHRIEFGYCYARDSWGRGYATEAARAMVRVWLKEPTIWRVQAFCKPENAASIHVLEKAGLTYEGTLRKHSLAPNMSDVPSDVRCYAIIRESH
jgi:[ribosomal protein S5]-alanine N-acetyltransferase